MKKSIDIVMIGDSITKRGDWKALLEEEHLVNLGVDGDTTLGVLERIDVIPELEPSFVFLMIGINDLCISVPIKEVFDNYKKIIEYLVEKKIKIIVQATLLTQMPAVNKKVKILNKMLIDYCYENSINHLDFNVNFSNENGLLREDLTIDGLHLGLKAYKAWAYKLKRSYLKK